MGGVNLTKPFLIGDGLHPTTEGNRVIARIIQCRLETCEEGWEEELSREIDQVEQRTSNKFNSENGVMMIEGPDGEARMMLGESATKLSLSVASLIGAYYLMI